MKELPLPVVLSAVIFENKILLLKRVKGDYIGFWSLPGGKIEKGEHVHDAAMREVLEESNVPTNFVNLSAIVSECIVENDKVSNHYLIHFCHLQGKSGKTVESSEGVLKWFELDKLEENENTIIPSDFLMIKHLMGRKGFSYYHCKVKKEGQSYNLESFK